MSQPAPKLDKTDARQGATGHKVRYVLMAGIALAVVVGMFVLTFLH